MGKTPSLNDIGTKTDAGWATTNHYATKSITLAKGEGNVADGTILGMTTADGKYRKVGRTTVHGTEPSGQTVISVHDASVISVADHVTICQKANASAIDSDFHVSAIDLTPNANTITLAYATNYQYTDGDLVRVVDGSETALGILCGNWDTGTSSNDEDYADIGAAMAIHAVQATESLLTGIDAKAKAELEPLVSFA